MKSLPILCVLLAMFLCPCAKADSKGPNAQKYEKASAEEYGGPTGVRTIGDRPRFFCWAAAGSTGFGEGVHCLVAP